MARTSRGYSSADAIDSPPLALVGSVCALAHERWPRWFPRQEFHTKGRPRTLTASETRKLWVTVGAILKRVVFGGMGHERGPGATVHDLCRGARRGDRACGSGGAVT